MKSGSNEIILTNESFPEVEHNVLLRLGLWKRVGSVVDLVEELVRDVQPGDVLVRQEAGGGVRAGELGRRDGD